VGTNIFRKVIGTFALAAALVPAAPAAADPGEPSPTWIPNGKVTATAISGSTLYVGGEFDRVGPYTGGSIRTNPLTGDLRTPWPEVSGSVTAATPDGNGGWYLGGSFDAVGGIPVRNVAHVNPDGSVEAAFDPVTDAHVTSIAVTATTVYVGGNFTKVDDAPQRGVAAIDRATGERMPALGGVSGDVQSLAIGGPAADPVLYVGGFFTTAGGAPRVGLAAYSVKTNEITAWNPTVSGTVVDIDPTPTGVYIAGSFDKVGAATRTGAAFVDGTTALAGAWDPRIAWNGNVFAIEAGPNGDVVVAGAAGLVNKGLPTERGRRGVASFSASTGVVTSWAPTIDESVIDLELVGGTAYVTGAFSTVQGKPRQGAAAIDTTSAALTDWDPGIHGNGANVLTSDGTDVVVGGFFDTAGGVPRRGLAAIDLTTGRPTGFNANIDNGRVLSLTVGSGAVWAGGSFTQIAGAPAQTDIAKFDPTTGQRLEFTQQTDGQVRSLVVDGADVYAAGNFTKVGTITRTGAAAFRDVPGTAGALLPWAPDTNAAVNSIARAPDGRIYLGGEFTALKGGTVPRRYLAAVDGVGAGTPTTWNPDVNAKVHAVSLTGDTILAAGEFTMVNGATPRRGAATFDNGTGAVGGWNGGLNGNVRAIAAKGEDIYAGGVFTQAGTTARSNVAGFSAGGGLLPWSPRPAASVDPVPVQSITTGGEGWFAVAGQFRIGLGDGRTANLAVWKPRTVPPGPMGPDGGAGGPGGGGGGGGAGGSGGGPGGGVGPTAERDRRAPVLSRLGVNRKKFRVGRPPRRGTTFTLTLDEPGRVTFELVNVRPGRKAAKAPGSFSKTLKMGRSKVAWDGKIRRRALRPGRYKVRVTVRDAAGNTSRPRTVNLRIVR
jgi:hypothetical protein